MTLEQDLQGLVAALQALGVRPGQDLLVHSSLRRVGPVEGGAATVLEALRAAAWPATIVVPTHTAWNSRSSRDFLDTTATMDPAQLDRYVADMPGFDPYATPSSCMGVLAEQLRTTPGAVRSRHPQTSFAAMGPAATECMDRHVLDCHLGELSPMGWLYENDAAVLLLGVSYMACTAFHLAEYRLSERRYRNYRCFTIEDRQRCDVEFDDVDLIDSDFAAIGAQMDLEPFVHRGRVGAAGCRLVGIRDAVDFAVIQPLFRWNRMIT